MITTEIDHDARLDAVLGQRKAGYFTHSPAPEFQIDCGQASHTGLKRANNQDSFCTAPNLGLWLIADGMGGHAHGELASAMARDRILGEIFDGRSLEHAIAVANRDITHFAELQNQAVQQGAIVPGSVQNDARSMGTTVVALRISGADFELAWVGDSRCYVHLDHELKQLSLDHSFVQELVSGGILSPEQAKTSRYRHVVTQALGVTHAAELKIDTLRGTLRSGMQFLLCSDGLTEEVSDADIRRILQSNWVAQAAADQMIAAALAQGGSDNVTVIVLRVG